MTRIKDLPTTTSVSSADYIIVDQGTATPVTRRTTLASALAQVGGAEVLSAVTGTDTITATSPQVFAAYTAGQRFQFKPAGANTTSGVTLNVNGVGAKSVVLSNNSAPSAGALPANGWLTVEYNGTAFVVVNSAVGAAVPTTATGFVAATNAQAAIAEIASDLVATDGVNGSNLIGFLQAGTGASTTRTAQAKMREVLSVLDFGADSTGVADSTAAIQAAIDAVYSPAANVGWGGTLLFPPGTYAISSALTIDKHINIEAYGARINSSGARCFDIGNAAYLTDLAAGYYRVRIAGLYIQHAGASEVIRNQGIRRVVLERVQTRGGLHSFYSEGAFDEPVIDNCRFQDATSHGINLAQRNNLFTIRNTNVLGAAGYGIHLNTVSAELKGVKLYAIDFEGNAGALYIAGNTGNVMVDGCWFESNSLFNIKVDNTAGTANKYGITVNNCQLTGGGLDVILGTDAAGTLIDGVTVKDNEFTDCNLTIISWDKVTNFVQHSNRRSGTSNFVLDSSFDNIRLGRGKGGIVSNTVFGNSAGNALDQSTALGNQNSFFGYQAGTATTTGYNNCFFGRWAGVTNTTGFANVAIGNRSLQNPTTSSNNVAVGNATLTGVTSGNSNTAIGSNAGATLTTSVESVALGINAMNGPASLSRCIAIGKEAAATATTGITDAIIIGTQATATGNNSIAIGTGVTAGLNTIQLGNGSIATANVQVAWTITSDRRVKTDVKTLDLGLSFLNSLAPVSYKRVGSDEEELGFIAQDVEQALPRPLGLVQKSEEGMYGLRKDDLIAVLVKAVQELSARVTQLEAAAT